MSKATNERKVQVVGIMLAGWVLYCFWQLGMFAKTETSWIILETFNNGTFLPILLECVKSAMWPAVGVFIAMRIKFLPTLDQMALKLDAFIEERKARSDKPSEGEAGEKKKYLTLALIAGALFLWQSGSLPMPGPGPNPTPIVLKDPKGVIFVVHSSLSREQNDLTINGKIDAALQSKGIERRRLRAGQAVEGAEDWVKAGMAKAPTDKPSLVVWYGDEKFKVEDLTQDKLEALCGISG